MRCSSIKITLLQGGILFIWLVGGCSEPCRRCSAVHATAFPAKTSVAQVQPRQIATEQKPKAIMAFETKQAKPDCIDIVDTALEQGNFNTLVTSIELTDLEDTLRSKGPFTVFAPTDEAFSRLPQGTLQSYLEPENVSSLESLLAYHIIPGAYTAADLEQLKVVYDVQGRKLEIERCPKCISVNDISMTKTDIITCNGIIHVIDGVLTP